MSLKKTSHASVLAEIAPLVSNVSPYRPLFERDGSHRLLLNGFDVPLHEQGFGCLCRALNGIGEAAFIYGQIERFPEDDDDWIVTCDDFSGYYSIESFVESLLCSVNATWVILCSSEGHSVAASRNDRFIEAIAREVDVNPLDDAIELANNWQAIYDLVREPTDLRAAAPDWIPALFRQVLALEIADVAVGHHDQWAQKQEQD